MTGEKDRFYSELSDLFLQTLNEYDNQNATYEMKKNWLAEKLEAVVLNDRLSR